MSKRRVDDKKASIIRMIDELFGDTSVEASVTLDALEEIQSEVESKIDAIKADLNGKSG